MITADWQSIAESAVKYSAGHGFEPTTWATVPYRLMGISRECEELTEALEAWGSRRPRLRNLTLALSLRAHVEHELADVAIYAVLILAHLGQDSWTLRGGLNEPIEVLSAPDRIVRPMRRYATDAYEHWRHGNRRDVQHCLELVAVAAEEVALDVLHESLRDLVRVRLEAMAGRPKRHNGKDPRT